MPNFRQPSPYAWMLRLFAALAVNLLIIGSFSVCAQENANNTNAGNANVNAARNTNAGTNGNVNAGNTNVNANVNTGQGTTATPSPSPTPDPTVEGRRAKLVDSNWYFALVSLIFAAILIPFAYTIYRAIRYSSSTYGPLGLPEGSLRALLAFTLVVFLGFYILASILSLTSFDPPQFLLGIIATVIGFYFGSRTNNDARGAGGEARTGSVEVMVTNASGGAVQDATVELTLESGKKQTEPTGADGKCKFENVPVGKHTVVATPSGGTPSARQDAQVTSGKTTQVKIQTH